MFAKLIFDTMINNLYRSNDPDFPYDLSSHDREALINTILVAEWMSRYESYDGVYDLAMWENVQEQAIQELMKLPD